MNNISDILKKKLLQLPSSPGVYLLKNAEDKITYIGIVGNLKTKIPQIFIKKKEFSEDYKVFNECFDFDFIVSKTIEDAVLKRNKLIKKFKPEHNVLDIKISDKISEKLKLLPHKPGVYLMKNKNDKIIYIGKSVNLKSRVSSYFVKTKKHFKTLALVRNIYSFDYIITSNEHEALLLEDNLIKKHKPKYNILLKDDKTYPFIEITKEDFPRVQITRKHIKRGSKYFGPYTKTKYARMAIDIVQKLFPIRDCKLSIKENENARNRPCINYQIGKCAAPCVQKISKKEYNKYIDLIKSFLRGNDELIRKELNQLMQKYAAELKFEQAAEIRDRINILEGIYQKQTIYFSDKKNRHAIGIYKEKNLSAAAILKFTNGKLLNREIFPIKNVANLEDKKLLTAFLKQYYLPIEEELPKEILLPFETDEFRLLNEIFNNRLQVPQRGIKIKVLKLAKENAFTYIEEIKLRKMKKTVRASKPIIELKEKLKLSQLPNKIACFDISHLQGTETVSSAVFFLNGKPSKKNYRKFTIKTVNQIDDFASMQETLTRYINNIREGNFLKPDLFVIDGGKGQLSSVMKIMEEQNVKDIDVISLAKRLEEVFVPNSKKSIILKKSSGALKILINIRDEAHRFAVSFHRDLRSKRTLNTKLTQINGIGKNLAISLLMEFGSIENIKKQEPIKLTVIKGIGLKKAEKLLEKIKEL